MYISLSLYIYIYIYIYIQLYYIYTYIHIYVYTALSSSAALSSGAFEEAKLAAGLGPSYYPTSSNITNIIYRY